MPLYEYECFLCEYRFERIQKVMADPIKVCPACGGAVRRLLGVPALQFKGTGWYVTDYGKGSGSRPPEKNGRATDEARNGAPPADKSADSGGDSSKSSSDSTSSAEKKASASDAKKKKGSD